MMMMILMDFTGGSKDDEKMKINLEGISLQGQ